MSDADSVLSSEDERPVYFKPFTRESLKVITQRRIDERIKQKELAAKKAEIEESQEKLKSKKKAKEKTYEDDSEDEGPRPDAALEQGMPLPIRMAAAFTQDLAYIPLEDFDNFYANIPTFVIVTKNKDIFRFSATKAVYLLDPFNPVRRVAVGILTHGLFSVVIITTILTNCYVMILPGSPVTESTEVIFTAIYTFESAVKVMARGFILEKFTYLRDAWNWLDFVVISLHLHNVSNAPEGLTYITMGINLGNLAALRTFRVLRALKTVAIVPGLKTIVGAVIESVKNLRDVIILTMFGLGVFALIGLQIYMGVLTQVCIRDFEEDGSEGEQRDKNWAAWNMNETNWDPGLTDPTQLGLMGYPLCGNSSGAGPCKGNYTCLAGFAPNPNYGFTSFDSFGSAFLSAFRLMTQDFWESLYQQILRAAGPWHILFFIVIIFLGSYYLVNLILAIVAMSYDELNRKSKDEDEANAAEMEAMLAEDEKRAEKVKARELREMKEAEEALELDVERRSGVMGSPSQVSPGGDSVDDSRTHLHHLGRNTSISVPGSPYVDRSIRGSRMVLSTYMDAQNHLPYADDSTAATPMSEENGAMILTHHYSFHGNGQHYFHQPSFGGLSSYNSHASRLSYTSHDFLSKRHPNAVVTKESQLMQRMSSDHKHFDSGSTCRSMMDLQTKKYRAMSASQAELFQQPSTALDMNDVLVLNEIIEQAAGHRTPRLSELPPPSEIQERVPFKELLKQKIIEGCFRCIDIFCVWNCGFPWSLFKKIVAFLVFDPFMELFITLAIVVNTVFMALDHHGLEENYIMDRTLKTGNVVFTTIFTIECSMKLVAMSPKFYFQFGWNVFDFIIVALSLIEMKFEDAGLPGISALRSFRLLRVFKLAKSWPTLNLLISIMGKTMGALGNLVFVFVIIVFIFAVMGMQLFAKNYFDQVGKFPGGEMPRWNFTDFGHSFMIIFRVLCGEWIESMWDCMLVTGAACVPFFLATVVIGNLVVLNLFLALLLSSFGASNLSVPIADAETNKLAEAFARIGRFNRWVKGLVVSFFRGIFNLIVKAKNRVLPGPPEPPPPEPEPEIVVKRRPRLAETARMVMNSKRLMNDLKRLHPAEEEKPAADTLSMASYGSHNYIITAGLEKGKARKGKNKQNAQAQQDENIEKDNDQDTDGGEEADEPWDDEDQDGDGDEGEDGEGDKQPQQHVVKAEEPEEEYPTDCMPPRFYERFPFFRFDDTPFGVMWTNLRLKTFRLIENKYFETAVITMILLSSLALALEDVNLPHDPILTDILFHMDRIFTVIFFFEMLIKWLALGFVGYFTNAWCWLDFVIVMVSLINFVAALLGFGSVQAFKTMRTLRALRPLRAMSRMQGMRIVVNALVQAIPSIFNVLLVCLIFWLIFAIMVQLFNGKYHKCKDPVDDTIPDYRVIDNKLECLANNFTWVNAPQNFDHVGNAYLCLFQVATFKGWMDIMYAAIDARDKDQQPAKEFNFAMYIYFVVFIVFGSFFTLNLFIGVIIDNFNEQKKKSGGSMEMFMTEDQKKYYAAMKKMGNKKPVKAIPRPTWRPQAIVFGIVTNQKFDMIIMLFIGVNMITMTMDHYQQTKFWDNLLDGFNAVFIAIFSCECFSKIFALRHHYFTEPWNLFDFVVVLMSIAGLMLADLIEKYFVSPTLLRVVRVAKVGRVLRLVKGAKGIRTLLFALAMSLPALFNICLLLFLVMFIFSIFGMSFFKDVKLREGLNEVYNFQTFGKSIILLFQMSTSAGWAEVLAGIIREDDCKQPDTDLGETGDCGNAKVGIAFLLSYLVMTFLIIINMYIAVILENYSQATEEVQEGLTDDDYDVFYEIWSQFDADGTQYIRYDQLSDFLDVLEPPLQIHKPNKYKIISMDIAICRGDMMYCADILEALTKEFFARKGNPIDAEAVEVGEVKPIADIPGYEPVSSTLWRQREEYCARLIQHAWRRHKSGVGALDTGHHSNEGAEEKERIETVLEEEPDEFVVVTTTGSPSSSSTHQQQIATAPPQL